MLILESFLPMILKTLFLWDDCACGLQKAKSILLFIVVFLKYTHLLIVANTQSLYTYMLSRYVSDLWKDVPIPPTELSPPFQELHYRISKKYAIIFLRNTL